MNIKIFGNLFFKINSNDQILDHIIICIYGLLQKHIMTLVELNENHINIYNDIKSLIFQCVDKRYLNLENPSYAMRNTICDCISILIISGITHSWENCIEELISKAKTGSKNRNNELIYICLRSIADCDIIDNLMKADDEENEWGDYPNSGNKKKNKIKDKLMNKGEIIFNFINKIYENINQFETNLKFRIMKAIIDLIIFWSQFNINILTNNNISTIVMEFINQSININKDEKYQMKQISLSIDIIKNVAELMNRCIQSSSNCRLYEFYPKIDECDFPEETIKNINENINIEEKQGTEKWLDFILNILEQYLKIKNKNEKIIWALAQMFCSIIENYIFLFFDLNNPRSKAVFKWLKIFISEKRIISWMFFDTIGNMMNFIIDYFRFYSYDETQKKNFAEYLMNILLNIMENCSYKYLKDNDYSQLQKEILFLNNESNWNTNYKYNEYNEGEENIQVDDVDINEYRNNAEDVIYSIYLIFKLGFNSNTYELELLKKLLNLVNIDNSININNIGQNELNKNAIKLDIILFTLKSIVKCLDNESNPVILNIINEYIYHLQNSIYINNTQIFIDYLLLVNQFSSFIFKNENNFQNIISKILSVTELNNNQILIHSCYIILSNLCKEFERNTIYKNYFELFLKRYKILCANYSLNNISPLENFIRIMFYSLGIQTDTNNQNNTKEISNSNNNNVLISCINEIIEPLLFKNIIRKQADKIRIKNEIIKSYILFKEIFYHIISCEDNLRKYLVNSFISNSINELMNTNGDSQSGDNNIKIFTLFPDDNDIINPIINFYSLNANYIAEDCQNIFNIINVGFINLLKSNIHFFKIIDFLAYFYKYRLKDLKENNNNFIDINKYILESFLFIIKIGINYIASEKNSNEETLHRIELILNSINEVFPMIYLQESDINIFNDIISIINFIFNLIDSISTTKKEEINDKFISNIIKAISSVLNDNVLKIISKCLQQNQRKELVKTIFDKTYKLLNSNEFKILSSQDLPNLYYQIIYFDISLFNRALFLLLNSTRKFKDMDIKNIIKYIQTFYTNKDKIIELMKDVISIILNKKQTDCLEFYFNQLITKKL